ncbi:uncharacterized protein LAJ45_08475 [Morchella importuna]|uniref:Uncharacterized protein n=1 Tax=Morchella conica CCBAS932 TaxID=1392247 RepID=A0A3N4KQQ7_9PEZI|nr:uncharacterized protein LAJ45_08475 [Morchella importuna]KAH8147319.1 hypothetical protein LAJ45_08475 [Morchella importuna]RPB08095.1 hypothetical protein P167DRAFT_608951 [Morchella conica CCBAS932]
MPPPPPPPPELASQTCVWRLKEPLTIISCDNLTDTAQPLRIAPLQIFILLHPESSSTPVWFGYAETHTFTTSLFPAVEGVSRDATSVVGKAAYLGEWTGERRCEVTFSREVVRVGEEVGAVGSVGGSGRTAYVEMRDEWVEGGGLEGGEWVVDW